MPLENSMDNLIIKFDADLTALSSDELIALNQEMGRRIDQIRAYRRDINAARDARIIQELSQPGQVDIMVPVEPLVGKINNG